MSNSTHTRPSSVLSQPVPMSMHTSSSSSTGHGGYMRSISGARPSSSYASDAVNLAEAFADVNRALGSRRTRQSMVGESSSRAVPAQAPKTPSPEPPRPRTLKKPQPASDNSARMDMSRFVETRSRGEVVNPRFSTASEPAYTQPLTPWAHLRVQDGSRRASMIEQSTVPRRPELKIVIPGVPAARQARHGQRDVLDRGHKSAASKNHSDCVIM